MISNVRDILSAVSIEDVVGRRVQVVRKSGNPMCRCPFHGQGAERTPSLKLNVERDAWYCFGCKEHGSKVDFVMRHDGLEYVAALEVIAAEAGVEVKYDAAGAGAETGPRRQDLYAALTQAAVHYHNRLLENADALAYAASRGLDPDRCRRWQIGYSVGDRVADCGPDVDHLVAAGVLGRGEDKIRVYDPLSARLIIPLRDHAGRVVGFTARSLPGNESAAKYKNTADTPLFHKGEHLFGIDTAVQLLRKSADSALYVLEGQLKALACQENGLAAVAPGGAALSERQAVSLLRQSTKIVLCFDRVKSGGERDSAGCKAALQAAELLRSMEADVWFGFLELPELAPAGARDPDDLMAVNLQVKYQQVGLEDGLMDLCAGHLEAGSADWATAVSTLVLPVCCAHPDPLHVRTSLRRLSVLTGFSESELSGAATRRQQLAAGKGAGAQAPCPEAQPAATPVDTTLTPEKLLVAFALQWPHRGNDWQAVVPWVGLPEKLSAVLLASGRVREFADHAGVQPADAAARIAGLNPEQRVFLRQWASVPLPRPPTLEAVAALGRKIAEAEKAPRVRAYVAV